MRSRASSADGPTLEDLIRVVDEYAVSPEETAIVVDHLLRSGRARLRWARRTLARQQAPVEQRVSTNRLVGSGFVRSRDGSAQGRGGKPPA